MRSLNISSNLKHERQVFTFSSTIGGDSNMRELRLLVVFDSNFGVDYLINYLSGKAVKG